MAFSASCPSCGAPVAFKSTVSFHAVCEYCQSTLVRRGGNLENLGRMADLLEDASPIQLGTEGVYRGVHFAVIGRIQLKYSAGVWNEWHLLFDDNRSGWLSDAAGEYVVSFLTPPKAPLPDFNTLMPDGRAPGAEWHGGVHQLAGREFEVSNVEEAMCIAGEGELPFAFGAGYEAKLADFRATDESGYFASIDYSESPPLLFIGESLSFAKLRFANLRGGGSSGKKAEGVKALACSACGGPISIHDKSVQSVACPSCLTILDAADENLKVLQKVVATLNVEPTLALGSVGRFEDKDWTVIGFQQRSCKPVGFYDPWQEYLLHHPTEGFRWLVEADKHWTWVTPMSKPPRYTDGNPEALSAGERYTRYSAGEAVTRYVIGEFTWKVQLNEEWQTLDFIAPPRMLSRERSDKETTWSLAEYRTVDEIAAAFKLKQSLPDPVGVGAVQPNPHVEGTKATTKYFWKMMLMMVLMHAFWILSGGSALLDQRLVLSPGNEEEITSKTFMLDQGARNLVVTHDTNLSNNWIGLGMTLVEKRSGQAWPASVEMSYWSGYDDGAWSEGSRDHELVFRDLPAGEYYLVVDPEFSEANPTVVADRISVKRNRAVWSNFFIAVVVLTTLWLLAGYRRRSFETERWSFADFHSNGQERGAAGDGDNGGDGGDD